MLNRLPDSDAALPQQSSKQALRTAIAAASVALETTVDLNMSHMLKNST